MKLFRREQNVVTGDCQEFDQLAYRNEDGDVVVLDAIDPTPEGYEPFDPYSEDNKQSGGFGN